MQGHVHETLFYPHGMQQRHTDILFLPDSKGIERGLINLYPEVCYETFEGFGGAITDAAGYVYAHMSAQQQRELMETYFSPDNMNYRLVRVHMDSCDFSVDQYAALSDPRDVDLETFSFARTEKYILPMLEDARKASGGNIRLMLSAWSPPAFMKTNGQRCRGGKLRTEYRQMWADCICRYIREFQQRGYTVQRISVQNEPKAVQRWDSCIYTAEEEKAFLRDYLYPTLQKQGLGDVEIFIWDHNKERLYERVRDIVDGTTDHMIAGAAFHWYSGDHFDSVELVRTLYPGKKLIMSESCLEYTWYGNAMDATRGMLAHEIIGDLRHGMTAFYDWNILLDHNGGPNHAGNLCDAPFLYDLENRVLKVQDTQKYFYHFSHYIREGARRIATSQYTDKLECVAYKNPDGSIVLVILSRCGSEVPVTLRIHDAIAALTVHPGAIISCLISL